MSKDDATWLNIAYVCFLAIAAYVTFKALETVGIQTGWLERFEWYSVAAPLVGIVIGSVITVVLRSNAERQEFLLSSISELRKVSWPTWTDTKRMTLIVCVVVGVFAVIVSVFDVIWARALRVLIS